MKPLRRKMASAVLALVLGTAPVFAAFNDDGWGARGPAMGGAFTAVADDADALLWNPAAPARLDLDQYNLMHAKPFLGVESVQLAMNSFAYAHPFQDGNNALSFGWTNLNASGLYREDSLLLSYSRGLFPWNTGGSGRPSVYGGVNLKYLKTAFTLDSRSEIDPVFADGRTRGALTADVGMLGFWNRFSFGMALKNVTRPDVGFRDTDRVPMETRVGTAYRQNLLFFEDVSLSVEYANRGGDGGLHLGWENWFFERKAAFRAGWNDRSISFGFGYRLMMPGSWNLGFDYTYQVPMRLADEGSGSHRLSVSTRFGGVDPDQPRVFAVGNVQDEVVLPEGLGDASSPAMSSTPAKTVNLVGQAQAEILALEEMVQSRRLYPVRFIFQSQRVVTDSLVTLDRIVRILRKYPNLRMRVVGHPKTGGGTSAESLSTDRARTVAGYFVARGIAQGRLVTEQGASSDDDSRMISFSFFE